MNATSPVQKQRDASFARDPLRSYFDEPQKNEIYFLSGLTLDATVSIGPSLCFVECERSGNEMLV